MSWADYVHHVIVAISITVLFNHYEQLSRKHNNIQCFDSLCHMQISFHMTTHDSIWHLPWHIYDVLMLMLFSRVKVRCWHIYSMGEPFWHHLFLRVSSRFVPLEQWLLTMACTFSCPGPTHSLFWHFSLIKCAIVERTLMQVLKPRIRNHCCCWS